MATTNDAMYDALRAMYPTAGATLGDLLYAHWSAVGGYGTSTTRTNLITNPNFETNTTGWQALGTGTTITRITTDAYLGSASLQVTTGTVANSAAITLSASGNRTPVTAGLPYYLSAWVKVPTGQPSCSLRLRTLEFREDGTQNAAQVSSTTVVSDTDGWVRLSFADTPTGGATPTVTMSFRVEITTSVARTYLVDAVLFEQSSTLLPYFDGTYADTYTDYALTSQGWGGTAHGSASTAVWGWKPSLNLVNRGSLQYDYYVAQGAAGTTLGDLANSFWGDPDLSVSNLELEDGNDLLLENGDFMLLEVGNG